MTALGAPILASCGQGGSRPCDRGLAGRSDLGSSYPEMAAPGQLIKRQNLEGKFRPVRLDAL